MSNKFYFPFRLAAPGIVDIKSRIVAHCSTSMSSNVFILEFNNGYCMSSILPSSIKYFSKATLKLGYSGMTKFHVSLYAQAYPIQGSQRTELQINLV